MLQVIREIVRAELARGRGCRLGVVDGVFPHSEADDGNNYEVDVRLKHEDLTLRRVPLAVPHVGVAAPPRAGDLVLVQFVDGDLNQPLITGRFYHAAERPPLHRGDEILFEQRVSDGTLNHLRFTDDGTIYLQRDVAKPEDNSEASASIKLDGASGDIEISSGKLKLTLKKDDSLTIAVDGKPVKITCDTLTVEGNVEIQGDLKVAGSAGSTTIRGNEITGT